MNEQITPKGYVSRVKFQVTADNIKEACRADSHHCMIADAITARLPGVRNISVDMMHIRWSDPAKGWRYIYQAPKSAQIALIDFDMGLEIKPFSFEVRSGVATPMNLGRDKNRKRAHKVRENKIVKVTDKTMVHSVASRSVPMWPAGKWPAFQKHGDLKLNKVPTKPGERGRPKEWHPSHNSNRQFGMRGFTEGYEKVSKA